MCLNSRPTRTPLARGSLRGLQRHHALVVAVHAAFGQLGLDVVDALQAPFYWLLGIPQPTNRAVAAAQAARQLQRDAGASDAEQLLALQPQTAALAATCSSGIVA